MYEQNFNPYFVSLKSQINEIMQLGIAEYIATNELKFKFTLAFPPI